MNSCLPRTSALSLAMLSVLSPLAAQAESPLKVPDVVVSATRSEQSNVTLPAQIQVIGKEEIKATGAQNVADLLRTRSNVIVSDLFGDGSRPTIGVRGFSESAHSNTLIMVDGRRLNNIDIGSPQISQISLKDVERVEIISGSAGTLFGDQAVGGVINIITRTPDAFRASVGGGIDSYGGFSRRLNLENALDNGFSGRLSYDAKETSNYRVNNRLEQENFFARGEYGFKQGTVFIELQRNDEDLQVPGALTVAQEANDRKQHGSFTGSDFSDTTTDMQRLGGEFDLSEDWSLAADLTNTDANNPFVSFGGAGYQDRNMVTFTPRLLGAVPMNDGELVVTAGMDLETAEYKIVSAFTNRDIHADNSSFYAQAVVPVFSEVSITAGARHARQDSRITDALTYATGSDFSYEETVGELGAAWKPSSAWRVYGRVDQNFRFPKIDEQAYTSPGNVLKNQTGESYEAGVEWEIPSRRFALNVYRLDLEDEIAFDSSATQPTGAFFAGANVNFDPTRHDGINLEGWMDIGHGWSLSGSYTYTDAHFRSGALQGNDISFIPKHMGRVAANWNNNDRFNLYGEMQFTGERFASGDNANANAKVGNQTVFNLAASVEIMDDATLRLRVNNVLDERYNGFETAFGVFPAPERNGTVEVEWRFD